MKYLVFPLSFNKGMVFQLSTAVSKISDFSYIYKGHLPWLEESLCGVDISFGVQAPSKTHSKFSKGKPALHLFL